LLRAYERHDDCIVYIDELTSLGDSPKAKPGLLSVFTRGRQHINNGRSIRTTGIGATQAPYFVPRVVYRQSRSFAVFRLNDANDRKTVARFTHPMMNDNPDELPSGRWAKHSFWYFQDEARTPFRVKLKVK